MGFKNRAAILGAVAAVAAVYSSAAVAQGVPKAPPPAAPSVARFTYNNDDLQLKGYAVRDAAGSQYRLSRDGKILTVTRPAGPASVTRQYNFKDMTFVELAPGDSYPKDVGRMINLCDVNARDAQDATQWISHHLYAFDDKAAPSALNTLRLYVTSMPGSEFTVNAFQDGSIVGSVMYKNYGCGVKTEEITATLYAGDESVTLDVGRKIFTWRMFRGQDYEKVIGSKDLRVLNDALKTFMLAHLTGMKANLTKNGAVSAAYGFEIQALDTLSNKISAFVPAGQPGNWGGYAPSLPGASMRRVDNKQPAVFWPAMPAAVPAAKHWSAR